MDEIIYGTFGKLILDKLRGIYKAHYVLGEEKIDVLIDCDDVKELDVVAEFLKNYDNNFATILKIENLKKYLN